jgi:hypothetical protein
MDTSDKPEKERRQPRRGTLSLDEIFEVFARDADRQLTAGPTSEDDLAKFEARTGVALPASFRAFLARFGGGLYYQGHEIFGPTQVYIHDIELVPDLVGIRRWLGAQGLEVPAGALAFHRARGAIHVLEGGPGSPERVTTLGGSSSFPDLASFLEAIVLPRKAR